MLKGSLKRQLNENKRYWQELEVAQGDWKNGAMRAFQNFTADADNAAGTAEQMFTVAFSSAGNALATFCTTGKLNFKSFTLFPVVRYGQNYGTDGHDAGGKGRRFFIRLHD